MQEWGVYCKVNYWQVTSSIWKIFIFIFYLLNIFKALSVKQNQGLPCLLGVRHTPHPDALSFRPNCGAQIEACVREYESTMDLYESLQYRRQRFHP